MQVNGKSAAAGATRGFTTDCQAAPVRCFHRLVNVPVKAGRARRKTPHSGQSDLDCYTEPSNTAGESTTSASCLNPGVSPPTLDDTRSLCAIPNGVLAHWRARTYIFNWLFARQHGGKVVLRIDDTDRERSTDEALQSIIDGLRWLELPWDEQHYQSERRTKHVEAAEALLAKGLAYRDFTRQSALPEAKDAAGVRLTNPAMRELTRDESERRASAGEPFVIRFRVAHGSDRTVTFHDHVFGEQSRKIADIEDFALLRSNGSPTYHLASSVDDSDLGITHVIRGQDHLTNTFKHILLFEALGGDPPEFAPSAAAARP